MNLAERTPIPIMMQRTARWALAGVIAICWSAGELYAASDSITGKHIITAIGWIIVVVIAGRIGSIVERIGQPAVLGEIIAGIILSGMSLIGLSWLEPMRNSTIMKFLAEIGAILLLFQIGLEANLEEFRRVGMRATMVGTLGIILPFVGGYFVAQYLFPELGTKSWIFLGATLTATSVGITMRVFRDLGAERSTEASIILGAAVIDDILGIIILAIVQGLVISGTFELSQIGIIIFKALAFFVIAIALGRIFATYLAKLFARISTSASMKLLIPLSIALFFAYLAHLVGLAPIIGAFAAGLILDAVQFEHYDEPGIVKELERHVIPYVDSAMQGRLRSLTNQYRYDHVEQLIEPLGYFFVPIFFVMTGFSVDLRVITSPTVIVAGIFITTCAVVGKLVVGLVSGPGHRWVVGWGMVPRGEVGLIFASIGLSLGVVTAPEYAAIMIMVMMTTLLTPIVLSWLLHRSQQLAS